MSSLRVDADQLRRLAVHVEGLASELSTGNTAPPTGSSWQASLRAAVMAHGEVAAARGAFAERMLATSQKLSAAAAAYSGRDEELAAKLRDGAGPAA